MVYVPQRFNLAAQSRLQIKIIRVNFTAVIAALCLHFLQRDAFLDLRRKWIRGRYFLVLLLILFTVVFFLILLLLWWWRARWRRWFLRKVNSSSRVTIVCSMDILGRSCQGQVGVEGVVGPQSSWDLGQEVVAGQCPFLARQGQVVVEVLRRPSIRCKWLEPCACQSIRSLWCRQSGTIVSTPQECCWSSDKVFSNVAGVTLWHVSLPERDRWGERDRYHPA